MGYSLCIAAIFGHFQTALIFRILVCFCPPYAENSLNVFVETFFVCLKQFYFLTQSEYFAWAIAFAMRPFLAISIMLSFFEY